MPDVVRLHDQVVRVRREGEPEPDDVHVLRLEVEEGARAALPVRALLRRVCLLDVEEHASLLVLGPVMRAESDVTQGTEIVPARRVASRRPPPNYHRHMSRVASR